MDRLQLFRGLLQQLDPTRPLLDPAERTLYVRPPAGVATELARTLQVDPTSAHLVVGAIGCGKSTELIAAAYALDETPDVLARYLEVSHAMDLSVSDGVALAVACLDELVGLLRAMASEAVGLDELTAELGPYLDGYDDEFHDAPNRGEPGYVPPRLTRPTLGLPADMAELIPVFTRAVNIIRQQWSAGLVWFLDGLDRMSDPVAFDRLVSPFLRLLKHVGVGVAIVGPRRVVAGVDRLGAAQEFDYLHEMGPVDPSPESGGHAFLEQVLVARGLGSVIAKPEREALVRWSGGAIRILLQLTREAVKETWVRNADGVTTEQVDAAADRVGRSLLMGLSDDELRLLRRLVDSGVFAVRDEEDAALVLTNRVLGYHQPSGGIRYAVHPALVPWVRSLTEPTTAAPPGW